MTQLKKRAIWNLVIWIIVLCGFTIVFFTGGGPEHFTENDSRVALTRIFYTVGFLVFWIMMYLTRHKKGSTGLITDERDEQIQRKAYISGFSLTVIYVSLLCFFLYWLYKVDAGSQVLPVGWVWFIACTCVFMGFICTSVAVLIFNARMSGNGQG
ncbi:hypothetical protein ACFLT9_02200 [Acidobacteriota bacterium]